MKVSLHCKDCGKHVITISKGKFRVGTEVLCKTCAGKYQNVKPLPAQERRETFDVNSFFGHMFGGYGK